MRPPHAEACQQNFENGAKPRSNGNAKGNQHPQPEIEAIYSYAEASGQVAFEVISFVFPQIGGGYVTDARGKRRKEFRQRRPSGEGDQSWLWGLDAGEFMRRAPGKNWIRFDPAKFEQYPATRQRKIFNGAAIILYQLLELIAAVAAGRTICVVEDEPEVDFLRSLDFCATCCPGGIPNWRPEHSAFLQGADVVLYNDAKIIAPKLAPIAHRLRILPVKGDVVDCSAGEFSHLIAAATDYTPEERPESKPAAQPDSEATPAYVFLDPDSIAALRRRYGQSDAPFPSQEVVAAFPSTTGIELTKLTKDGGPLTKQISLSRNGALEKDGSACVMAQGRAERIRVDGVAGLATLIESLTSSQAIALGVLRAGLPNRVAVTTKKRLAHGVQGADVITRTGANIVYHGRAFALLDYDSKGMPASIAAELERAGGFWHALLTVLPNLSGVARVMRRSTSAGLSRSDTGEALPESDGVHAYLTSKDGGDNERFLTTLHERCWLAGLGWYVVSTSGALLERSIVDRMVGGPERLVFEGGPVLGPLLRQDKESRRPIVVDGAVLDTGAACPPLSIVEQARLDELKAKERERLAPEVAKAQETFVEAQAKKLAVRTGMAENAARQVIIRQCEGVLRPDVELPFDAEELNGCTVGNVLADPERFEGETLADPLEGVSYGRCKAQIRRRADGTPWIHSFAHGRTIYELKLDATAVRKMMEKTEKNKVVPIFAQLAAGADLDAVELEDLRQTAHRLSGIGLRTIHAALKSAQQQLATQGTRAARGRRQDPRPQIRSPIPDEPWRPQMRVLNEVIGKITIAAPPSRDIDDDAMRVCKIRIPDMHAFSNANQEGDDDE